MNETQSFQSINAAAERAAAAAPHLRHLLARFPDVPARLAAGADPEALADTGPDTSDVAAALRRRRNALFLALALVDIAGLMPPETVAARLSGFADAALDAALTQAVRLRTPGLDPAGFAILALGKHGGCEVNYSSDLDLVFLYDPDRLPCRPREEPHQAAVRIGQKIVELMQNRTADGFVFRIDLRLRPSPEATPIALPAEAAISYYESSALPWERAAFIRARACAGDRALGQAFLEAIHPFVWRRSLDYGAIGEIQGLTRRIRDHYAGGQAFGPGYDLKRGRGGIREIEFFAQSHQLIHGGRDPALRSAATLPALVALAAAGHVPADVADVLADAYRALRRAEHRLQMIEDRQTHSLPTDAGALDAVASLDGFADGAALLDHLRPHVEAVAAIYGELGGEGGEGMLPRDGAALEARLKAAGFDDPAGARMRIEGWRSGAPRALRTAAAIDAFEAMLAPLVDALGGSPAPMTALNRFDDLVRGLPSGVNFFRLLEARPGLAGIVATILAQAPPLADLLGRRPELLDGLVDASALAPAPDVPALAAGFARAARGDEDYQLLLDRVRAEVNERRFALGAQLVLARADPLDVAAGYARVAEACLGVLAAATIDEFARVHGRVPDSELLVLGLGRLGGRALTHASDLDLVYLFTGDFAARSDGARPLGATDYYNRLAARVSAALSVRTAAGPLYQVDTRLRPSGADGLLAVSLDSFAAYQAGAAWTFEHMALTRARPVFGSPAGRAALQAVLDDVLARPRDPARVAADAAAMRADMARAKPAGGPFDVKLADGGLVDLEFALHTLQLVHRVGLRPRLADAIAALAEAGLVDPAIADAHRLLGRMLVTLRLVAPGAGEPPPASRALVAAACMLPDWPSLLAAHADARQRVGDLWHRVRTTW